jgi:hypothetical protein
VTLIFDLRWLLRVIMAGALLGLFCLFFAPVPAGASVAKSAPTLVLPWQQIWPLIIGAIVPLFTYVLNHVGPWLSEPIKAAVLVLAAAIATALYTALATNVIGFNDATLQLVMTGVIAALASHHLLWKPSGIALTLGAGTNRQQVVRASSAKPTPVAATPPAAGTPVGPDAPQA